MDWPHLAEAVSDCIALVLALRLLALKLHTVYRVFCLFLIFEVAASGVALWIQLANPHAVDYRIVWLGFAPVGWILYVALIYTLLKALLEKFPGILNFSRKVLHFSFAAAAVIGVATAYPEFLAQERTVGPVQTLGRLVEAGMVGERIFSMVVALALIATLAFILWFPVRMPRNLAVFSVGFIVYFVAKTSLLLVYSFWPGLDLAVLNAATLLTISFCLLYFLIFINKAGEEIPARLGHAWNAAEQQRLIAQLEAMNAALLRAGRSGSGSLVR